ncbi:hypothetical protein [Metabacillus sp. RGM 3146]|uniref:hypothetical protein n=1 Tax=Metabacillus sp. RGM 3146 TaxID=3401092 RepID=UPI003B9954F9
MEKKDYLSKMLVFKIIGAHVEWGGQEGILIILEEFENEADRFVSEQGLYLV